MDGNGSLFGTLSGNTREVLHKFTVDLPQEARARRAVRTALCAAAHGEAPQLRAQGALHRCQHPPALNAQVQV